MLITHGEVNSELSSILEAIKCPDREVASPLQALKISSAFPLLMLCSNLLTWVVFYLWEVFSTGGFGFKWGLYVDAVGIVMADEGWYTLLASLVISVLAILIFYPQTLMLVSIPNEVRSTSRIIRKISSGYKKILFSLWGVSVFLAVIGLCTDNFILLYSFPVVTFMSIFIFNGYISMESVRYGLGPFLESASSILNKK